MIRPIDIQESMLHLIGWKQNYDTSDLRIAESLTESESGMYFQQVHPLLTLENISSIAPDFSNTTYRAFDPDGPYYKGNVISYNGKLYKALQDTTGSQPDISPEQWGETFPFSEWLEEKTKASIQKAVYRYYNEKLVSKTGKVLCESKTLFTATSRIADREHNRDNVVGFEIVPVRSLGVTVRIDKIGLQFTKPGTYRLYLMHSSSEQPIRTIELEKKIGNTMEWFRFSDLFLPYQSDTTDAGGSWYLCYKQSELPEGSEAIKKDRDWSKGPCRSCSRSEYLSWMAWSKYLEVHPFSTEELPDTEGFTLWDIEDNSYTYDTNYGINLEVTVACDVTDFIIQQRHLFQDVIAKQVAVDMLREFAYNPNVRTNRRSINASRTDILYELDGDSGSMKKSGLNYQLDMAFDAVKVSTDGMSRVCLPCRNNGIKYRTV